MKSPFIPVFFVCLASLLSGCTDQQDCCTHIDLSIDVELKNSSGADMLDPSTSGYIPKQDISVFYEVDGRLETYVSMNEGAVLDNPSGFMIIQPDGYLLRIYGNPTPGKDVITLIRIKDRQEIRLVTNVEKNNGIQITELRYNDQLVWANTMSSQQSPRVTVVVD
jgi:hypothetical protein